MGAKKESDTILCAHRTFYLNTAKGPHPAARAIERCGSIGAIHMTAVTRMSYSHDRAKDSILHIHTGAFTPIAVLN